MTGRFRWLAVPLFLVFCLRFFSQWCLIVSSGDRSHLEAAASLFPVDPEPLTTGGHRLLAGAQEKRDEAAILRSINRFQRAINRNALYYQAYFYMGKAYLILNRPNSGDFSRGLTSLKRSAAIRRNNARVIADTLQILFSLWPHLDPPDREYAASLFRVVSPRMKKPGMAVLLEFWGLYVRDIPLLMDGLAAAPRHLQAAAGAVYRYRMDLVHRHRLMARYESYQLETFRRRIREFQKKPEASPSKLLHMEKSLDRIIRGYHLLVAESGFDKKKLDDLREYLKKNVLRVLFQTSAWKRDPLVRKEITAELIRLVHRINDRELLEHYHEFLVKNQFLERQDLDVFYLRQLIQFKLHRFDRVVFEIEEFRKTLSYVKKESVGTYTALLFLLADGYMGSRLLSKAQTVLDEIETLSPGNMETCWRRIQIESVFGPADHPDEKKASLRRDVRESRMIRIGGKRTSRVVYRIDSGPLEFNFSEGFWKTQNGGDLLQVFVNDRIVAERYIRDIRQSFAIPMDSEGAFDKLAVAVRIVE